MSHPPGYYHLRRPSSQLPATAAFPQSHPTTSAHIHHHQLPPIPSFQFQTPSSYLFPAAPNNNTTHHYYMPSDSDSDFPSFASHSRIRTINPPIPPTPNSDHLPPSNSNDDHVRRLRDEVLYLHGLWHKGPPPPNSASIPTSTTTFTPPQQQSRLVKLSQPTSFKKKSKKKRNNHKRSDDPLPISDKEWPLLPQPPDPALNTSDWPVLTPRPHPHPHPAAAPVTEEEAASVRAMRIQHKGFNSFRDFMLQKSGSASSGSDPLESDTDEDCEDLKNCFSKTFQEDGELRDYYENNWENGHFRCLVCGGIRQKVGRKFKNLVALVQHSVSVSKTKKKKAHRIYAQAICNLLSWDINQLPSISENDEPAQNTGNSAYNAAETISGAEKGANLDNSAGVDRNIDEANTVKDNTDGKDEKVKGGQA